MHNFEIDSLSFDVRDRGPSDSDEVVVLLHGFPQDSTSWVAVGDALADQGHRVLIPDMRGYSPRACPTRISAYSSPRLVGDVVALLDAAGVQRAHVVGHDWGGSLVWTMRKTHPHRLKTATIVSTPHPKALNWAFLHTGQALRSWYMPAIAIPALPEYVLRHHLARILTASGLPADRARYYQERLTSDQLATGAVNWYRQMLREMIRPAAHPRPEDAMTADPPPTSYIWGRDDAFFNRAVAERTATTLPGISFEEIAGGHWLPETAADELTKHIAAHVARA